ncbi:MAG: hypothetical protein ACE5HE_15095 [Phycisphaerae bacterium]
MVFSQNAVRRRVKAGVGLLIGALLQLGLIQSCDDRLIGLTRIFDPCGTILGNCQPGDFEANAARIPDRCVDPGCVIPGACDAVTQAPPLGTQRDVPGC